MVAHRTHLAVAGDIAVRWPDTGEAWLLFDQANVEDASLDRAYNAELRRRRRAGFTGRPRTFRPRPGETVIDPRPTPKETQS